MFTDPKSRAELLRWSIEHLRAMLQAETERRARIRTQGHAAVLLVPTAVTLAVQIESPPPWLAALEILAIACGGYTVWLWYSLMRVDSGSGRPGFAAVAPESFMTLGAAGEDERNFVVLEQLREQYVQVVRQVRDVGSQLAVVRGKSLNATMWTLVLVAATLIARVLL